MESGKRFRHRTMLRNGMNTLLVKCGADTGFGCKRFYQYGGLEEAASCPTCHYKTRLAEKLIAKQQMRAR